jgi:hypothetical protein
MATDFQREHQTPGGRFRPGPGAVGTKAGLQAGRAAAKPDAGGGRPKSRQSGGGGGGLGLPAQAPPEAAPPEYRHLLVLGQYENMKDLGNDAPFGIQAINNGEFRRIFKPGMMPFDWFLDT